VAKFDTQTNAWTIFSPPTYPGQVRRPNVDSKNNIWFGIWAAGLRPGKLAKLDQTTGRFTEYTVPMQNAEPYDVEADSQDNIWASDAGQDAAIWKFDVQDQTFTFYPKPQPAADSPKVQVTRDGSVWYTPRGSRNAPGVGVLYPDMDKITTLGAFYKNGPPGYPFQRDGGETK
jgi:streptogramin lyase